MQKRQTDRKLYFEELASTSEKYFVPYIQAHHPITPGMKVLEIGCGEGGNLLPLARMGCRVTGVDLAESKIANAITFFREAGAEGMFIARDIFQIKDFEHSFDLILCHDVIEHIDRKQAFLDGIARYLRPDGTAFISFPAWQMPFGGHQQICRSRLMSHWPFVHLLPASLYRTLLTRCGEQPSCIDELLAIKRTATPIELFERLLARSPLMKTDRQFYFINPHYEVKFGLRPRRLSRLIGAIPYVRNFFTTSCFYIVVPR